MIYPPVDVEYLKLYYGMADMNYGYARIALMNRLREFLPLLVLDNYFNLTLHCTKATKHIFLCLSVSLAKITSNVL